MPFTTNAGARLYWKVDGRSDAPSLVLLNSIGTDMDLWAATLPFLREHFSLLRIDTRGHGASTTEPGDFSLTLLAQDVLAIACDAGLARFTVAGVSLGGMIAMQLALSAPEKIDGLVLVCTSATMDPFAWTDRIAKVRSEGLGSIADLVMGRFLSDVTRNTHPGLYDSIRRQFLLMDAEVYAGCGAAIRDMDLAGRLSEIACPVLVITGTRDSSTPFLGHGDYLMAHLSGAAHRQIEAAHLAPLEAPEALARTIVEHMGKGSDEPRQAATH